MSDFDTLWVGSSTFRGLFIGKGRPFPRRASFDRDKAVALWENRHPRIIWSVCEVDGCTSLVQQGEYCSDHSFIAGKVPTWAWVKKVLFRYVSFQRGPQHTINDKEYRPWAIHTATRKFKEIPKGYHVHLRDGNVFNYRPDNLVLLSKYSFHLVQQKLVTLKDALEIDLLIGDFLSENMKAGRKPFSATFGYGDIRRVSGANLPYIRKQVERGNLDPSDLGSIVEFVNRHKNGDNVGMNGEG